MKAEMISHMGSDLTVVNSARVSFSKESQLELVAQSDTVAGYALSLKDRRLISYLANHGHWTPFAHPQITLRYTVPIFVARQEFKHIVGFTRNEVSRRYVDDTPEFYIPDEWRKRPDGSVKQGSSSDTISHLNESMLITFNDGTNAEVNNITTLYKDMLESVTGLYEAMIKSGVAPEQARMVLPQSMFTSYYVTGSLAAFARFYNQRTDAHAQVEIQELAKQVGAIIQPLYPVSWTALTGVGVLASSEDK